MSYQVGMFCYATPVDAGHATCADYRPVSAVASDGSAVIATSCEGVNDETGALKLRVSTAPLNGAAVTYQTVEQLPAYAPCQHGDWAGFWFAIIPAVLICLVPVLMYSIISRFLNYRENRD